MPLLFVIEDEAHAEKGSEHATLQEAIARLKELASIPWDQVAQSGTMHCVAHLWSPL
jgi:hypothetical protein